MSFLKGLFVWLLLIGGLAALAAFTFLALSLDVVEFQAGQAVRSPAASTQFRHIETVTIGRTITGTVPPSSP